MLWTYCTQYASKFGKLSSGHRTGKGQFSFQSQTKAMPKNLCLWTVVLKTLENPLDCKEIQPVNPKGNPSCIFIGRTDAEAETPILLPPDLKSWFIWKDHDAGKDWRQEEKGTTEDEMAGWYRRCDGHELKQALGVGDGQESLVCCSPWGHRVRHDWVTELNWTALFDQLLIYLKE